MRINQFLAAGMISLACLFVNAPTGSAETVRVMEGRAQAPLKVPLNRAVVVESDVVFAELSVANPTIADIATLSERTIYVLGKAPGRTTLTLLGPDGRLITNIEVQVAPDIAEIKERLSELLPGERIEVRTANDGIVLSGMVSSAPRLSRALEIGERYAPGAVLNLMSVGGTQQVMLKVKFAEMSRSLTKELAASLSVSGSTPIEAGGNGLQFGSTLSNGAANGVQATFDAGGLQFAAVLRALEAKGLVRTLSEPSLTALSGETADFLAGGEFPVPVRGSGEGADTVTISYKNFGISMEFTPVVLDGNIINLSVSSSVSGPDASLGATINGEFVTGFSERRTKTTVELRDGQSFAIGGLLQDEFIDGVSQLPWLGDIPILGSLFRSSSFERRQTELVIIITAHLVNPTSGEALALPTDRVRPPTESELFLFGQTAGPVGTGATSTSSRNNQDVQGLDFSGSYGYVLE